MTDTPTPTALFTSPASDSDWQYLEDLSCAYWKSEILFAALELDIFSYLQEAASTTLLAQLTKAEQYKLTRLLSALSKLHLVEQINGLWQNTPLANRYLDKSAAEHLGYFLLYRRYIQSPWQNIAGTITDSTTVPALATSDSYQKRTFHYVRALDELARLKAHEIVPHLTTLPLGNRFLDIGGGAGALCRELHNIIPGAVTVLFELPEIIEAAKQLYPQNSWHNIHATGGNFLDHDFTETATFSLAMLSNILHIYDYPMARSVLQKAISLVVDRGLILIHDYFPDRNHYPVKGALYDINMMVNTYNGSCHDSQAILSLLAEAGVKEPLIIDLESDSTIILASKP
jgi:SAM-dependent methyltransferase